MKIYIGEYDVDGIIDRAQVYIHVGEIDLFVNSGVLCIIKVSMSYRDELSMMFH